MENIFLKFKEYIQNPKSIMLFHTHTALLFYFLLTAARSSAFYITIFFSETFVGTRYAIVTSTLLLTRQK